MSVLNCEQKPVQLFPKSIMSAFSYLLSFIEDKNDRDFVKASIGAVIQGQELDENLLLIGPTRSGKSTLLRLIKKISPKAQILDDYVIGTRHTREGPKIVAANYNFGIVGFRTVYIRQPSSESMIDLNLFEKLYKIRHRIVVECMNVYEKAIKK
jgi:energy-coupling factor transporter ATP-binding protein EcfA2